MLGTIPQQLRYVLVVLIPKATTGLRPIGRNLHRGSPKTLTCPFCRQKDSDRLVPPETGVERSLAIGAAEGGSPKTNSLPGGRCECW